jgi:hypothetical protein
MVAETPLPVAAGESVIRPPSLGHELDIDIGAFYSPSISAPLWWSASSGWAGFIQTSTVGEFPGSIYTLFAHGEEDEWGPFSTQVLQQFRVTYPIPPLRVQYVFTHDVSLFPIGPRRRSSTLEGWALPPAESWLRFRLEAPATARTPTESEGPELPDVRRMLDTLTASLGLTHADLQQITGIGRTSLFYWKRGEIVPRPATIAPLLRLYALARGLLGHFDAAEDAAAWLRASRPSPLSLLLKGRFEKVEDVVASLVFADSDAGREPHSAFIPDEDFEAPRASPTRRPSPARRVRRPGDAGVP